MVEGGPGTIDTVRQALKNNTPCVVIDGSGRAADVLAYAVKMKEKYPEDDQKENIRNLVRKKAESDLNLKNSPGKLDESVNWLIECLQVGFIDKIRIYDFEEEEGDSTGKTLKHLVTAF